MRINSQTYPFSIKHESEIIPAFKGIIDSVNKGRKSPIFSGQFLSDVMMAFTEGVANAIKHGLELKRNGAVNGVFKISDKELQIRIDDHGKGFSLKRVRTPDFKSKKTSGRGIFLIHQLMDHVEYKKLKNKNSLILKRSWIGAIGSAKEIELIYEISQSVLQSDNPRKAYDIILEKLNQALPVKRASILIYDENQNCLKVASAIGLRSNVIKKTKIKPGEGISGFVFQHAKPCLIEDIEKNKSGWSKKKGYQSRSFISAPLILSPMRENQKVVGVINMTDRIDGKPFSKKELKLLATIANQAAVVLSIGELVREKEESQYLKRELVLASEIQKSYLPQVAPEVSGLDIAGWLKTSQKVGGDYYDFIQGKNGDLFIIVADVSGHDVGAAITMANFRSVLRMMVGLYSDVGEIATKINHFMHEDLANNYQFISFILIRFEKETGQFYYANAGHRPPLVFYNGKHLSHGSDLDSGTVIGVIDDEQYETIPLRFPLGALMVVVTDGVTEVMNSKGDRLGLNSLIEALNHGEFESSAQVIDFLKQKIKSFVKSKPLSDDVTIVSVLHQ